MLFDVINLVLAIAAIVCSILAHLETVEQNRLAATSVVSDWIRDVRVWAWESIDVLSEASAVSGGATDDRDAEPERNRVRQKLSALVDRGRLLLPNEWNDKIGQSKAIAYRGLRHAALDALVAAFDIVSGKEKTRGFPSTAVALIGVRREFVSTIQTILDPKSHNATIAKILKSSRDARAAGLEIEGLFAGNDILPTGAAGVIEAARRRYAKEPFE